MSQWITTLLNGISFGALLFLLSSGFTLAFGLMKIVNIAHGSFYMLGAYVAIAIVKASGSYVLGVVAGGVAVMIFAAAIEEFLLRRLHNNDLRQILMTMGISFVVAEGLLIVWGGNPLTISVPAWARGALVLGPVFYPKYRLFVIAVSAVIALILWILLERTRIGAAVRACVDDEQMAGAMRINTRLLFLSMFGLSAMLAGVGGAMGAPYIGAHPGLDFEILPLALVVVIIGGLGSLTGAMLGSLMVGVIDAFGKALFPELSYFTLFAPMILILMVKPTGLLGRE